MVLVRVVIASRARKSRRPDFLAYVVGASMNCVKAVSNGEVDTSTAVSLMSAYTVYAVILLSTNLCTTIMHSI